MTIEIELSRIEAARKVLDGKVLYTPLVKVEGYTTPAGHSIYLKAENLQPTGSFKVRGATYALSRLNEAERKAGVIAYSTGNHAQAVAQAARQQGIRAVIVMSPDAPAFKVEATRRLGAEVVMSEPTSQARRRLAEEMAQAQGLTLIPPYDHPAVITGQGTIGLEILEQNQPAAVFVPIGGGGLIARIAAAIKQRSPQVKVIGVEPEWENDAWQSFQQGQKVMLPAASATIADAIRVQVLGELTYPLICRYVDEIVTVSESEIAAATLLAARQTHLLLEPAGAVGFAAALAYQGNIANTGPVVALASGGNITLQTLSKLSAITDGSVAGNKPVSDKRVKFDFEIDFSNGGGIQGQDFRLDIDGDDISDEELAKHIVQDMRLLMVGEVRILNKEIITERHKRVV